MDAKTPDSLAEPREWKFAQLMIRQELVPRVAKPPRLQYILYHEDLDSKELHKLNLGDQKATQMLALLMETPGQVIPYAQLCKKLRLKVTRTMPPSVLRCHTLTIQTAFRDLGVDAVLAVTSGVGIALCKYRRPKAT